ncbi:WXG100 family type VII secretion target [Mycobacterium sp. URHB0044]|uniref:WXG100 family type VII secretion target n=1 Tax=Mycobacterium sp. URHB0044 TaxID=1380386 RepID=UPI0006871B5E|nr:WXG100 family type VII secretion target [Mycobacterium sp. URHB0044]
MGQSVEVVVSELHLAAARLDDAAGRLRDGLASVDDETKQLLGSGWKGGAASAYGPVWDQWHSGAEQVVTGLQRMSELLTIAGKEYARTDESGAEAIGSTVQGSNGSTGSGGGSPAGGPPDLGLGDGGGASNTGGAAATGQSAGGVQQAMSSASQLGQAAVQPLTQVGQAAAGFVQQAAQLAAGLAQQAAQAHDQGDASAEKDPEGAAGDGRERPNQSEKRDGEPDSAAAPSGDLSVGTAPVTPPSADRGAPTPSSDQAIKRTR